MKSLRVVGEKVFKNILIGPGKLPGLSRVAPESPSVMVRSFFNFMMPTVH